MIVISKRALKEFYTRVPMAESAVQVWYNIVSKADWSNAAEVKATFRTADSVGNDRFVFNLGGNKYRVVAMIHFTTRTLYIRFAGTHKEYDNINAKKI